MHISSAIFQRLKEMKPGEVFHIRDFDFLNNQSAVRMYIHRLHKQKQLGRLFKGLYFKNYCFENTKALSIEPDDCDVVAALERRKIENIQVHGEMALYLLGVNQHTPSSNIYYTSTYTRDEKIFNRDIRFVKTWKFEMFKFPYQHPVGVALSAIFFLGKWRLNTSIVNMIKTSLGPDHFSALMACDVPKWFRDSVTHLHSSNHTTQGKIC